MMVGSGSAYHGLPGKRVTLDGRSSSGILLSGESLVLESKERI